ncbi:hypothetical protein BJF85_03120 [Saccharomonospora sp. CUA-673]|nr:hypothetical protein BJF85_03120 [Saccharomonospora sp. CUA-673]
MNYDTGLNYLPDELSRVAWDPLVAERDMRVIAEQLHCTSVNIFGCELDRVESCARSAADLGLDVWIQPRLIDRPQREVLDHLAAAGDVAERLRRDGASVHLHVGCELTIFLPGVLPGDTYTERIELLSNAWPLPGEWDERLDDYLVRARTRARDVFAGPVTYAAGEWETVDWSAFDLVGVNLYRQDENRSGYAETVRNLVASEKPVVITEFGICSYAGADSAGGGGHDVVDFATTPPRIDPALPRDEAAQAEHLAELITLYAREGVAGCFVYAFSEPSNPYSPDPALDLDKASYGIVRTLPGVPTGGAWRPKRAFDRLAATYAMPDIGHGRDRGSPGR